MDSGQADGRELHVVLAPTWIGDTAMAGPFFASLRAALPQARIEAVASPWTAGLLGAFPWVDDIFTLERRAWSTFFAFRKRRRQVCFRALWLLPNSFRSALLGWFGGAERRIGYATDGRGWLLTHPISPPPSSPPPHLVDYYLGLLEGQGWKPIHRTARLPVPSAAAVFAEDLLGRMTPPGEGPLIGIHPGATFGESKVWAPESFGKLAALLAREQGARVLVLGGPGERALADRVCAASGATAANLAGRDTLATLPGILARLRILVSPDTGPLHVAALVGTPTVSLFGPTDPRRTAPRGLIHRVVRRDLECSPCFARTCPLGHHRCMVEITPEGVAEEVRALLGVTG